MIPPWNLNASVVVPWAILMGQLGLAWSSVAARSHAEGCERLVCNPLEIPFL